MKEDKKTSRNQGSLLKRADGLCLFITEEKEVDYLKKILNSVARDLELCFSL